MDNNYNNYCMIFSNEELQNYLISKVEKYASNKVRTLSEEGEEVSINSKEKIETIVFDGEDENLFINFYEIHTSIFVFDKEIMFIDEKFKSSYTSSDVYNNIVFEGQLREMSHMEFLQMLVDFVLCFIDSNDIDVLIEEDKGEKYKKFNYYTPHIFTISVDNEHNTKQEKIFENIKIKY